MISKPLSTFESCCSCCRRRRPMWQMNEYRAPPPEGCDPVWCSTVTPVTIPIPVVSAAKAKGKSNRTNPLVLLQRELVNRLPSPTFSSSPAPPIEENESTHTETRQD